MPFTEEQAKDQLEALGFEVIDASNSTFGGYSIEKDDEHGCWVVYELAHYPDRGMLRRNLSGWGVGFTLTEALQWLQAQIKEGRA